MSHRVKASRHQSVFRSKAAPSNPKLCALVDQKRLPATLSCVLYDYHRCSVGVVGEGHTNKTFKRRCQRGRSGPRVCVNTPHRPHTSPHNAYNVAVDTARITHCPGQLPSTFDSLIRVNLGKPWPIRKEREIRKDREPQRFTRSKLVWTSQTVIALFRVVLPTTNSNICFRDTTTACSTRENTQASGAPCSLGPPTG